MADEELEALRKQRLAELQAKHGDPSSEIAQQESKQREAEMRNNILAQVLDQAARARLSNLALVKPEKAKAVENYLIQMARFGQLGGKQELCVPYYQVLLPSQYFFCSCPDFLDIRTRVDRNT
ncbi:programmed cell death protein 5 isoform X2 [Ahaetulla prasina]|uniref:programmed cell death protein 5 isoform X2 n=1 Tax=Ahaetulla prasina TaxID=499056 RepID=UPI0026481F52|nr:programmed cell death protein 5 isoform X2 [Ahaetulla prasina]